MAAEKQTQKRKHGGSRFGRFRGRLADAAGATAMVHARGRAFGAFVRFGQPANDNRVPASLLFLRTVVLIALVGLMISAIF